MFAVSFFEVWGGLVLLEKNFERRRKILEGGKKYSGERETKKEEEEKTFLFEVFIFCPLLLIFSLLCARLRRIHTHTNVYTDINNSVS